MDLAPLLSRPFAHRGLHTASGPVENTLDAVEAAVRAGMGVEMDVQLSGDGVAVLHHDTSLLRIAGIDRRVHDLPAKELDLLDGAAPRLRDAIELMTDRGVPLLLDLKCNPRRGDRRRLAMEVARLTAGYDGPVACVGFDPLALAAVAATAPWVMRGQSAGVPLGSRTLPWARPVTHPLDALWFAPISRPHFVSYNVERLSRHQQERLRARMPVVGWTLRCTHRLRELVGGLDQVIVEGPAAVARDCEAGDVARFGCAAA